MYRVADLHLGPPTPADLSEAAQAVAEEHRAASRERRLELGAVTEVEGEPGLYRLDLRSELEADWTWEGATLHAPLAAAAPSESGASLASVVADADPDLAYTPGHWRGEVVEADDVAGRLYVDVSGGAGHPAPGEVVARPFEFLASLGALYARACDAKGGERLARALAAARAGAHSRVVEGAERSALPGLESLWSRSWGILWGPPGTGKTYTLGRQVAAELAGDAGRRVLVVSTTNKATDAAAIEVGRGLRERGLALDRAACLRIGVGAELSRFERARLGEMLPGDVLELRRELERLRARIASTPPADQRAALARQARRIARSIHAASLAPFLEPETRLVACTCFAALRSLGMREVADLLARGCAPFHTVIVDEAGLVSRAAAAALSLLAAERFVLVGDPRQLAPISTLARVLPTQRARWLAESALAHLELSDAARPGVHLLSEQHRMLPEIRRAVSSYQYGGALRDAASVSRRALLEWRDLDSPLHGQPRALWYVLDEESVERPQLRAERGPRGRSWMRRHALSVLERIFAAHPQLRATPGLYLAPFRAQARAVHAWLRRERSSWTASTIHRQQGAEADVVVFDTVHAGSSAWPHREWERLVTVGLSRARELVIVLASRDEMREPYLAPLAALLAPRVLRRGAWHPVDVDAPKHVPSVEIRRDPARLGAQLASRRALRALRTAEQERLAELDLDAGPRLVRGVAGSGKTFILAAWVARSARSATPGAAPLWVLYGNLALRGLIVQMVEAEWAELAAAQPFPWDRVRLWHVPEWLAQLALRFGVSLDGLDEFDLEGRARRILEALRGSGAEPLAQAAFVDEAQDLGTAVLELCAALLPPARPDDPTHRPIRILYDNAQNVYGRRTPRWSELGLEMRGRSSVLDASFRGTRPIAELALNVLYRLRDPGRDPDHREQLERGQIERAVRGGRPWWRVHFAALAGPLPVLERFLERARELDALSARAAHWIGVEGVSPSDIRVIVNGASLRAAVVGELQRALAGLGVRVLEQRNRSFTQRDDTVVVTTAHSYKGYEAEVVCVPCADGFVTSAGEILARPLYSALTRARSILYVSGTSGQGAARDRLLDLLAATLAQLDPGDVE